ncbi:MAG TPA: NADH-quinone oxidoreductase subunit N [Spirochaetia bacterium]|nr:NADH-quinone oxidoreductase subunit N [Spirochaetia bacterium]
MSASDLLGLFPLIMLAGASILVLLAAAFVRRLIVSLVVTLVGCAAALACVGSAWPHLPLKVAALLSFDGFVLFGFVLILAATIFVAISSWAYLRGRDDEGGDYYFLLILSSLGACILAASTAFASFFLGLELLSVSLYALIGWRRERAAGTEAAIKYLILAGATSSFVLFGMALIYEATGSMDLFRLASISSADGLIAPVGLGMILVGIGFKLAVVPFHLWTPDVYDGAPAPVTAFIATVSKGAMVVVLARALGPAFVGSGGVSHMSTAAPSLVAAGFPWVFALIAGLSMFAGNLLALREKNVKRILAYSSIAHLGYILVAFLAGGPQALRAIAFYLVAYFAMTLGAFAVISTLSSPERDADDLEDYRGLAGRSPWTAAMLTTMLLSLAGLPLTAGFVGKFLILSAGAGAELWTLAVILAINGTISIFYYLKIVSVMFRGAEPAHAGPAGQPVPAETGTARVPLSGAVGAPLLAAIAIAVLALAVVALGVYPAPFLSIIGSFTAAGG